MMLGVRSHGGAALHVTPWSFVADNHNSSLIPNDAADHNTSVDHDSLTPLQRYLPSNTYDAVPEFQFPPSDSDCNVNGDILPVDAHSCDDFRMFEFKVKMCSRTRSHDWTACPFAHPGEKARRRDPRKFHYSGTACPDFRKGSCFEGESCEFAHGVFECWLHPARYRTQPCKDGMNCTRRVCFFAHSPEQLRVLSPKSDDGLHHRVAFVSSTESDSPAVESPPITPVAANSVDRAVASLRQLEIHKVNSMPSCWKSGGFSPRVKMTTHAVTRSGIGYFDGWDEEEPVMVRVESGRDLRARMFEKLIRENPLDRVHSEPNSNPDVGLGLGAGKVENIVGG
ncbi:hypothetical protein CDL12_26283 [Handroanthus impetiginosus]|uniref:C3H1-type domain-containing protein n=1 Tax=Handroanthus impetiginosus TaxID=429701 RepID=A0A2G9G7D4_9LAMI|nr:hypothetical protein CDL12_26283 [Handroanthus impetiginosus]